jgi:hypothetical protein
MTEVVVAIHPDELARFFVCLYIVKIPFSLTVHLFAEGSLLGDHSYLKRQKNE